MASMTTTTRKIVVAVNPTASFGKNATVGDRVASRLRAEGHDVTVLQEDSYAELCRVASFALRTVPDAFVVVGGDGMVSLGANLLATTTVPLGIIPTGTGNDMARALGIPHSDPDAAIDTLIEALSRPGLEIDAGRIRHLDERTGDASVTWFASVLSAGFDATVNERANRLRWPKGSNRYLVALAIELARLRPITYTLTLDGVEIVTQAALISIGNGVSIGGGMKVTPDAMLDDGQFDVLVVQPLSRMAFLRLFPRVFSGTHTTDDRVAVYRATNVTVDSPGVVAFADGERVGPLPVEAELVPGALFVLAPEPRLDPSKVFGQHE
jgi:diacylglycerol kinase (ATP)